LRLAPLPGWGYLAVKAAAAMLVVLPALLVVFGVAAVVKGVDLGVGIWLPVLFTAWPSVLPFAAVGLLIGMAATPDSAQCSVLVLLAWLVAVGVLVIVRYRRDALRV
jgi:ABC-2 type transport system permease protein